jgi:crotonobetainyl-CoA:carnitine CoA-transferase CaiB-like acyl-CoA transferase
MSSTESAIPSSTVAERFHPLGVLDDVLAGTGFAVGDTGGSISFSGADPIFESRLRLAAGIGVPVMAAAVGAASAWRLNTGESQDLHLDLRQAIHGITPHFAWHPTVNGMPHGHALVLDNFFLLAPYKTRDGRVVMASGVYPHMAASWLRFLDCAPEWEKVVAALARWDSAELEDAANAQGLPLTIARTPEEWLAHPQGQVLAAKPVIEVEKIADCEPKPLGLGSASLSGAAALSGVRVLSFTHAIAGPTVGRTLAEHGADVLNATFPNHFEHDFIYNEANVGSRSANLDLRIPEHRSHVERLLADTDVLVDNHRPGKLAEHGLDPNQLAERHPGIVTVKISAYGHDGPWADRAGFDMNGSAASGVMAIEGDDDDPKLPPTGMLNDFITGYLGAAGATAALLRRAHEGGSYRVDVSLARTGMFVTSLGTVDPTLAGSDRQHTPQDPPSVLADTPLGRLAQLAPPVHFSKTPPAWRDPILVPRCSSRPEWLPR